MNELITGFKDFPHTRLAGKTGTIIKALSEGDCLIWFADATAERDAVAVVGDAFSKALAMETSKSVTILRHSLRTTLRSKLKIIAAKLEIIADGDLVKLSKTGFDLRKKPVRGEGSPEMPLKVRLRNGPLSGWLKGSCKPDPHASSYEVQVCGDPMAGDWVHAGVFTDSRNFAFKGQERGKDVFMRVRVVGANGQSAWSAFASAMVV